MHRRTTKTDAHWIASLALLGLLAAACNPSPHLDPPSGGTGGGVGGTGTTITEGGGGTGGTGTTTPGTGGSSPVDCASNADCAYPKNLCDTAAGICVECLVSSDCGAKPGTVCSEASCVCPGTAETFCAADGYGPARCVDLDTAGKDCGACGHECFGTCAAGACSDAWEPTAKVGAPAPRAYHVAVWTGSMMIVWGGEGSEVFGNGAMYDPDKRTWTAMSNSNAPSPRSFATAVWNGTEMIVWGGRGPGGVPLDDGGKFNPTTNSWSNVATGGPSARYQHTAIWTDNQTQRMIVWGGYDGGAELSTGGYLTSGNAWLEVNPLGPPTERRLHTAVWDDA
ncbi:MAG: hypothetical protein R3F14_32385, partial [Polyangiaceae bacterium]